MLRVMVGFHFYSEGVAKLKTNGSWTAEHFLSGAKGPFAPMFHEMLDDETGKFRLCMEQVKDEKDGSLKWTTYPKLTESIWLDFIDAADSHFDFNSTQLVDELQANRAELKSRIEAAKKAKDKTVNTRELERRRLDDEMSILAIRTQLQDAKKIFEDHQEELNDWLDFNRTELIAYFNTQERSSGFERDGPNREQVAVYVESLQNQVDTIRSDRKKKRDAWSTEIENIWDSFETQINNLAVSTQVDEGRLAIHRPFDQPTSALKYIDQFIPLFDTLIGALLILGLFTRFASLSAAIFLASVILSQPFWIPASKPTYYESVEFFALLVLFATCAGRYGGLDFFFSQRNQGNVVEVNQ